MPVFVMGVSRVTGRGARNGMVARGGNLSWSFRGARINAGSGDRGKGDSGTDRPRFSKDGKGGVTDYLLNLWCG